MSCWQKRTKLERRCLVISIILLVTITTLITLLLVFKADNYCHSAACVKMSHKILQVADLQQDPCDDFYKFSCDYEKSKYWTVNKSEGQLKRILIEPNDVEPVSKSLQLQKKYYNSCMDLPAIEADNNEAFMEIVNKIGGWPVIGGNNWNESAYDFIELMVDLHKAGVKFDWLLNISTYSRGEASTTILQINLPQSFNKIVNQSMEKDYVNLMSEVAVLFKAHFYVAKVEMREVMYFETRLANLVDAVRKENEELFPDSPPVMTIAEVQVSWQKINWIELLNQITNNQLSNHDQVAFFARNYLSKLDGLLKQFKKRTQVNYVVWKLVEHYYPLLSSTIRQKITQFKRIYNQDKHYRDQEQYCFDTSRNLFRYALEATYLRRYVNHTKRVKIEEIIDRVKRQLEIHLMKVKWMDQDTKEAAVRKLRDVSFIIGGPEEMYYVNQFDNNYIGVENMFFNSSNVFEIVTEVTSKISDESFNLKKLRNKNYQKQEFYGQVSSWRVHFLQDYNLLHIPAGALQDIFYDEERPNYINYGTLAATISRELTHGFDNGTIGNKIWWSNETQTNFEESIKCLSNKTCTSDHTGDCAEESLGILADNTGINLAYEAYQQWVIEHDHESNLPGLELTGNQMLWLSYGALMCHMSVAEPNNCSHAISAEKVEGPVKDSSHFAADFGCSHNSKMNPSDKCQIL